jgi:alpha-tubulin suppressor-like RCC1 family protein
MAAIKTDGTLWTWGRNVDGELGDNTTIDKSSPIQTTMSGTNWKQVNTRGATTIAITYVDP